MIRLSKKFHAHDENNEFGIGDRDHHRIPPALEDQDLGGFGFGGKGTSGVMPVAERKPLYNAHFSIASFWRLTRTGSKTGLV